MDFFRENAAEIYEVKGVSKWSIFFVSMLICTIPALITYKVVESTYTQENMEEIIKDFKLLIKYRKQQAKKKTVDESDLSKADQACKTHVLQTGNFHQKKNFKKLKEVLETIDSNHNIHTKLNDDENEDGIIATYCDLTQQLHNL